ETLEAKLGVGTIAIGERTFQIEIGDASVKLDGHDVPFRVADFQSGGAPGAHNAGAARVGKIKPPMPGKIVSVAVQEGQEVAAGQLLFVLEAMKMQNEVTAPGAGKVKKVNVKPGQNVEAKDVLVELE